MTFTETGFPPGTDQRAGRDVLRHKRVIGNKSASGTEIMDELGRGRNHIQEHMIVYTSADSVLQICGNEETFDLA